MKKLTEQEFLKMPINTVIGEKEISNYKYIAIKISAEKWTVIVGDSNKSIDQIIKEELPKGEYITNILLIEQYFPFEDIVFEKYYEGYSKEMKDYILKKNIIFNEKIKWEMFHD